MSANNVDYQSHLLFGHLLCIKQRSKASIIYRLPWAQTSLQLSS